MGGGRAPCCDKNNVKRGPWSPAEDLRLAAFIQKHGHGNWRSLPKQAGLLRCGKSCRLRWINYLSPNVKRGNFTLQEEETIIKLHHSYGNKWSKIAAQLPGRTDNEIKNVWNTHLKKRLLPGKADCKHQKINETKTNSCSPKSSNSPASSTTTTTTDTCRKNRGTVEITTSDDHDHDHDQDPVAKMAEDVVLPENCQKKETSRSSSFSSNASNFSSLNTPLQMDQNVAKPSQETESLFSYSLDSNLQELLNELDDVMDSEFDLWNVLENFKDPQDQSSNEINNNRINSDDIELSEWYRYLKNSEVGLEGIIGEEEKKGDQNVDFSKEVLSLEPEEIADSFPLWPASPHNF